MRAIEKILALLSILATVITLVAAKTSTNDCDNPDILKMFLAIGILFGVSSFILSFRLTQKRRKNQRALCLFMGVLISLWIFSGLKIYQLSLVVIGDCS